MFAWLNFRIFYKGPQGPGTPVDLNFAQPARNLDIKTFGRVSHAQRNQMEKINPPSQKKPYFQVMIQYH